MNIKLSFKFLLALFPAGLLAAGARAQITNGVQAVVCHHEIRRNPNLSIHWLWLDLADTNIALHVAMAGGAPTNSGHWVTTLLPPSEIAEREHFDVAINGDFFLAENTVDIEGKKTGYVRGKLSEPRGPAMTDGKLWHAATEVRSCLEITISNTARIFVCNPSDPVDPAARQIIGGRPIIVQDGQPVTYTNKFSTTRHPRTAVGVDKSGHRLLLLEVDGRQPNLSVGMSLKELSAEMLRLGAYTALNLDGGGSSTMVWRDPATHKLKILNSPSDTRERSVAEILGATIKVPMLEAN